MIETSLFSSLIGFFIVLTPLIFIHELGHYLAAIRSGVKVESFSIGFGPELLGYTDKRNTRWKISLLPLGGYVKMKGELISNEDLKNEDNDSFLKASLKNRDHKNNGGLKQIIIKPAKNKKALNNRGNIYKDMRKFTDGETIYIEPWRAKALPIIKDLVVDRSAFDRIQQAGGYISVNTSGNTQDANLTPIPKNDADKSFDAATCIGCAACVATCKNSSAMLFVSAKVSQYAMLPQGRVEAKERVINMVKQMDKEGFGNCSNTGACEIECPKGISLENIAKLNREYLSATLSTK